MDSFEQAIVSGLIVGTLISIAFVLQAGLRDIACAIRERAASGPGSGT